MDGQTINLKWLADQRGRRVAKQPTESLVDALELSLRKVAEPIDENESGHRVLVWHLQAAAQYL